MNEHEIKSPEVQSTSQVNNLSMAQTKNLTIPVAIIVAGMLIAGAVYFSASKNTTIAGVNNQPQQGAEQLTFDIGICGTVASSPAQQPQLVPKVAPSQITWSSLERNP